MRNLKNYLHIAILLTVCLAVFLVKCRIAYPVKYVGHADASGYAEMADSLIHGRGFEVDYISWYFIKYDPDIVRPEDHWPPLYSMAIAPFFLVLGKTAFAAKLPSLIISCFLFPLVLYSLARELSGSKFAGLAAGLSILLYPFIFGWSLHCLSDVIYAFVISAGVLYAVKALDNDKFFYPLGIFMGLAYYAKGSGLVTIPGYVLFYVIARRSIKKVFTDRKFLTSLLIAFLILLPWMIRNYVHFRDPFFSTQRFSAGYVGYEDWEEGTYELYWGEKPPPSYFDKFRESLLFSVKSGFQTDLDTGTISADLREEFKNNRISLSKDARVSVKKTDSRWLIKDNQIYTIRRKGDELNIYEGGIPHVVKMTIDYLKIYFWWTFMDLRRGWGKFSNEALLTYFTNAPAILGIFLLWGNRKRHAVWIISGLLILFLSIGWSPIDRLALPMTGLMMALGWATYFVVIKAILRLLSKIPLRRLAFESRNLLGRGNLERKRREALAFIRKGALRIKAGGGIGMLAGVITFCLVMPLVMRSADSVNTSMEKSGYPYREGAQEWMDMGKWLRENAPSDSITMTRNPWELHFYSEQLAIQIPRTNLQKTIEVMRFYRPNYIIPQLDIRPSLKPLVEGEVPGLELVYDNKKIQLYRIDYSLLPSGL